MYQDSLAFLQELKNQKLRHVSTVVFSSAARVGWSDPLPDSRSALSDFFPLDAAISAAPAFPNKPTLRVAAVSPSVTWRQVCPEAEIPLAERFVSSPFDLCAT